ncbi:hypothetical protein [Sphingomonas sp. 35-24ZXX]|uniref:hypothetical protein n=1 Tax=Sphingomonas sp. 35-24ZXX TaxID=1545915 RepID=UPI00068B96DE|nr:hypothetical protein [Sphingomonas sp. 35-24ZXX]
MSQRTPFPLRPVEGLSAGEDMLLGMVTALAAQLAATRERLDTLERVLARHGLPGTEEIEAFVPDADAERSRDALRQRMIARVFNPLLQSVESGFAGKESPEQ